MAPAGAAGAAMAGTGAGPRATGGGGAGAPGGCGIGAVASLLGLYTFTPSNQHLAVAIVQLGVILRIILNHTQGSGDSARDCATSQRRFYERRARSHSTKETEILRTCPANTPGWSQVYTWFEPPACNLRNGPATFPLVGVRPDVPLRKWWGILKNLAGANDANQWYPCKAWNVLPWISRKNLKSLVTCLEGIVIEVLAAKFAVILPLNFNPLLVRQPWAHRMWHRTYSRTFGNHRCKYRNTFSTNALLSPYTMRSLERNYM